MQSTSFIKLEEIKGFDSMSRANQKLSDGWVYLGLYVQRNVDSKGGFEDDLIFILGRPVQDEES